MSINLDKVKTIVLLMFENRSFDHLLGHLSLQQIKPDVRGLTEPLSNFSNKVGEKPFDAFPIDKDTSMDRDLPHSRDEVDAQLRKDPTTGEFTMGGFAEAYIKPEHSISTENCAPMGFFERDKVSMTSFLAENFCTCDNWFTPIPTGTQPNRNMAISGNSSISDNASIQNIDPNNIFTWLKKNGVKWRVYHAGLSFFLLYQNMWLTVLGKNFRHYDQLSGDIQFEDEKDSPEVIVIEPRYKDAPHLERPNDNHPPLAIGFGEDFLRRTYEALSSNAKKWESTVFIVYYDEHGGFYDHMPPPKIGFKTGDEHQFECMGPRVPAIIASTLAHQGSVSHLLFDHTSVLQLLAEKFTPGTEYSPLVAARKAAGVQSISALLNNPTPFPAPLPPTKPFEVHDMLGSNIAEGPQTEVSEAFETAANLLLLKYPKKVRAKYPELLQWKISADNAIEQSKTL